MPFRFRESDLATIERRRSKDELRAHAASVARQTAFVSAPLVEFDSRAEIGKALELLRGEDPDFAYARVCDEVGVPLASVGPAPSVPCPVGVVIEIVDHRGLLHIQMPFVDGGRTWGALQLGISEARRKKADAQTWSLALGASLLIMLVTLISGIYLARSIAYPVSRLAEAVSRVRQDDWEVRIDVHNGDEVGVLAKSFQSMVEELHRSNPYIQDILQSMPGFCDCVRSEREHSNGQSGYPTRRCLASSICSPLGRKSPGVQILASILLQRSESSCYLVVRLRLRIDNRPGFGSPFRSWLRRSRTNVC